MVGMGLPARLLGNGETELLTTRTHGKSMIRPTLVLLLIAVVAGVLLAFVPASWQPGAGWAVVIGALVAAVPAWLLPLLRWRTTTFSLTNFRLITRRGIINKTGHDLPLSRISNVAYERSLSDRFFGCGTLVFTTSAEAPVALRDIPDVEAVGVQISSLLFSSERPAAG